MSAFALDDSHDVFTSGGSLARVSDIDAVVQRITTRLKHYLEEWYLDKASGTPWFEDIFVTTPNIGKVESILKSRIEDTPDVTGLTDFSADLSKEREYTVTFVADTDFGSTGVVEVVV